MIAWLLKAALDVRVANLLGATFAGHPEASALLDCVSWRESRHELVSVHAGDRWMERSLGEGMGTRGVHGMVVSFTLPTWLHWAPWLLDVPLSSAFFATRRARSWQCRATPACIRWRGCGR